MARKWQKTAIFSCNFDLFLAFFIDCDHIYIPKRTNWGSSSRPHIGDLVMSLFFTLGSTGHGWGWHKNAIFATNVSFLRVIADLQIQFSIICNKYHVIMHFLCKKCCLLSPKSTFLSQGFQQVKKYVNRNKS